MALIFNTIKTTSFTLPSVIKLHLLFAHAFTCFGFLVNLLQKAYQLFKGNYHYIIQSYIQQQEDQTNTKDNIPPIEEATERRPYGLRIFQNFKQHQSTF
jgi:hypothetical protein